MLFLWGNATKPNWAWTISDNDKAQGVEYSDWPGSISKYDTGRLGLVNSNSFINDLQNVDLPVFLLPIIMIIFGVGSSLFDFNRFNSFIQ